MKRIILFLFLFFNLFPVIEKGKLTLSVPMSCLAQNEGEGGESDPCDMASPDYDENLCFLSMCDPESKNYDDYTSICDPDSPNYDKELCCAWYSEGCDDTGGGNVCDLISPDYNESACADDICNTSSPNYDEIACSGGGDGGICDPSSPYYDEEACYGYNTGDICDPASPNYDEIACYGGGDGGICDPASPYYDEIACYGGGDGGICDPASPYYDEEACYGYNTGDICDPTSPYYDEIACFGYDSGDICDPLSASFNEAACSGNDTGDVCDSNSVMYNESVCMSQGGSSGNTNEHIEVPTPITTDPCSIKGKQIGIRATAIYDDPNVIAKTNSINTNAHLRMREQGFPIESNNAPGDIVEATIMKPYELHIPTSSTTIATNHVHLTNQPPSPADLATIGALIIKNPSALGGFITTDNGNGDYFYGVSDIESLKHFTSIFSNIYDPDPLVRNFKAGTVYRKAYNEAYQAFSKSNVPYTDSAALAYILKALNIGVILYQKDPADGKFKAISSSYHKADNSTSPPTAAYFSSIVCN